MCGIAGMWTTGRLGERDIVRMTRALAHRGPDDEGVWVDDDAGIGLGNRRLAIIDLSPAGHQPMVSHSGRFVLTFNGEIYNHADLRRELEIAGDREWRGHSDTETLLAAIDRWGLGPALAKCVGMYALALWDRKERVLALARDRMGEKPLYYGWSRSGFLFGSELKALAACPGFSPTIDRTALDQYLRRSYVPAPRSIYDNVYKLDPGCILSLRATAAAAKSPDFHGWPFSSQRLTLEPYWSYRAALERGLADQAADEPAALGELERLLVQSVRQQSVADVPVGTFLSGGYDSSTIAALQQHHGPSAVETFTIGFDEPGFDEAPAARAVAAHLGTSHHEMRVTSSDALDLIPSLPTIYDEPFADSSQIPTHLLSRLARKHVTVALSGDGGDELFGGYNRFVFFERYRRRLARLPAPLRRAAAGLIDAVGTVRLDALGSATGLARRFPQPGLKAQKLAGLLAEGDRLPTLYDRLMSQWPAGIVLGAEPATPWPKEVPLDGAGDAQQMMLWDTTGYLPDDILVKVDRASMAASLETHAPFLDHRVVEFAARLPVGMKIRDGSGKWILRQLLYKYVPPKLVDRPKAGFAIPLGEWLRGPLRGWAESLLSPARLRHDGFFAAERVRERWTAHLDGKRDYSTPLWSVLMFQAWRDSAMTNAHETAAAAE